MNKDRTLSAAMLALSMTLVSVSATPVFASSLDCGKASWYALHSRTASGEMMNPAKLTAAHRTLRFGTKVRVTNAHNGKSVIVRINDRGPFVRGRVIDVSKAAAHKIGMVGSGVAKVCYTVIS